VAYLFRRMGREAMTAIAAMRRASEAGDRAAAAQAAHGLAGIAGSLGALRLHEAARSVELQARDRSARPGGA
jgi:HPt (histidine-containing phosphotransfer) domain-containing protein